MATYTCMNWVLTSKQTQLLHLLVQWTDMIPSIEHLLISNRMMNFDGCHFETKLCVRERSRSRSRSRPARRSRSRQPLCVMCGQLLQEDDIDLSTMVAKEERDVIRYLQDNVRSHSSHGRRKRL
ncbi:hypothetical protein J6590_100652 [Homalodisca vitripennis]|nr:hypothetical protein J6590_100652 [Homalodisca vitripennis]